MKKGAKNVIAMLAIAAAVVASMFIFAALYASNKAQKNELTDELNASDTELYIRQYATNTRADRIKREEEAYQQRIEYRKQLKEEMLENDTEDLLELVNPWNEIEDDENGQRMVKIGRRGKDEDMYFDERGAAALKSMLTDCEAAGCRPVVISAYRTHEYQTELYEDKVRRVLSTGESAETAEETAAKSVAKPGTSEHELGLAVDIIDDYNQNLDLTQEWTDTQRWLIQHCTEYGFILRYPNGMTEKTGIIYEPWHYRYVGLEIASDYTESGCTTFEEYLEKRGE